MDEQLTKTLIEYLGPSGALLVALMLMRPIFLQWLENSRENQKARNRQNERQLEQDRELQQTLDGVKNEMILMRQVNSQFGQLIGMLPTQQDFDQFKIVMRQHYTQHDQALGNISQQLDAVETGIKAIPVNVWTAGEVRLESLCDKLKTYIQGLEDKIVARVGNDSMVNNVKDEFESILNRLQEIERTLHQLSQVNKDG